MYSLHTALCLSQHLELTEDELKHRIGFKTKLITLYDLELLCSLTSRPTST